jgi:hypothetical protein
MNMNINKTLTAAVLAASALAAQAAAADILLSPHPTGFGPPVETFEGFDGLVTTGPTVLGGGVTLTSSIDATLGAFIADLGANGIWGGSDRFAGIGDLSGFGGETVGSMTFAFAAPAFAAGVFLNHYVPPGGSASVTIEALGSGDSVLESQKLTVFTDPLGYDAGLFVGVNRPTADLFGLRISGDGFVLDDLFVTQSEIASVPLPAAALLLGGALGLMGLMPRRRPAR